MTANHTPKLNLMSPVDSDIFTSADFADTFGKIDAAPGIATAANYAALLALTWTSNQHGRTVLQLDNGAMWYWYNPSGSGTWKRVNSIGLIRRSVQGADVSTSAISGLGVLAVQTGNIVIPGGRGLHINAQFGLDNNVADNSMVAVSLTDNGSTLKYAGFRVGKHFFNDGNVQNLDWFIPTPTPNSTHNYGVYIRAESGTTAQGGHGTAAARTSVLSVVEV